MRKELQHALTRGVQHVSRPTATTPYNSRSVRRSMTEAESTREMNQLRHFIAEQAEAMQRFESHSQQFVSQQQEELMYTSSMLTSSSLTVLSETKMR